MDSLVAFGWTILALGAAVACLGLVGLRGRERWGWLWIAIGLALALASIDCVRPIVANGLAA